MSERVSPCCDGCWGCAVCWETSLFSTDLLMLSADASCSNHCALTRKETVRCTAWLCERVVVALVPGCSLERIASQCSKLAAVIGAAPTTATAPGGTRCGVGAWATPTLPQPASRGTPPSSQTPKPCLLYTSDAADDLLCVD